MRIGVPRETKDREYRVAVTPEGVAALVADGHSVVVERGAGAQAGFPDADYLRAGASLGSAAQAWERDLVVKVKEPLPAEYRFLNGQILFTYLHLAAAERALTETLLATRTTGIAYETVTSARGGLPLLAPMSAVAGNMASTMGSYYLAHYNGGRGTQLGRIDDQRHGQVVVIGDGVVGSHATRTAAALGAQVTLFGRRPGRLEALREFVGAPFEYVESTPRRIAAALPGADLVVGAVLLPGARAPHVVTREMVKTMPAGAVIVDVSIDQGGCVETSRPTSHSKPVFVVDDVIHYCVTNMPGAYPRTATQALTHATLPYLRRLASQGMQGVWQDPGFAAGVNTFAGTITNRAVAEALQMMDRYREPGASPGQ